MEMNFKIADSVTFGFSVGGSKSDTSKEVVPGNAIIIAGSYGHYFVNENAPHGTAQEEE